MDRGTLLRYDPFVASVRVNVVSDTRRLTRRVAARAAGVAVLLAVGASCAGSPRVEEEKHMPPLRAYLVERSKSPWRGYTGSSEEEQAGYEVAAVAITDAMERLPHLRSYQLDGEPLLAVDREGKRVVVNERFFGPLHRPDAPRLAPGEHVQVGTVKEPRLLADPLTLFSFLIEGELVRTYWHLEAALELVAITESGTTTTAEVRGSHLYFTNERNEDRYAFRIELDRSSGAVAVVGIE